MFYRELSKWLTNLRGVLILVLLGFSIYFNSFGNGFIADDYHQIVDNPTVHSLVNIPTYFTGSTFYIGDSELSGNYYKPFLMTGYSFLFSMFGKNPVGYHFIQVTIHILNAILLFFFCKQYFSRILALGISFIFLSHPINNEAVVYISALQETLFLCFGLTAFLIQRMVYSKSKSLTVGIFLLSSLLSKETGVVFLVLFPLSLYFEKQNWKKGIVITGVVFGIYCGMRFLLAGVYFNTLTTSPIMGLSFAERLMHIPTIVFFYLTTFFFPKDLVMFQTQIIQQITFNNFFLPLIGVIIFGGLLVSFGVYIYNKSQNYFFTYLFFLWWFLIGLSLHLQIFPLDATVADRWFYHPIIGLLGIGATIISVLNKVYKISSWVQSICLFFFIFLILLFSLRVIVRNTNWKDQLTLTMNDIQINTNSYQLEEGYGLELMKLGRYDEAHVHLLQATKIFPTVNNLTSLGVLYGNTKQFEKSKLIFEKAMQYDASIITYENYALLLYLQKDTRGMYNFTQTAVKQFPKSYKLWFFLSISAYELGFDQDALSAATNAYLLKSDATREYLLNTIKNRGKIDSSRL